MNAAVHAKSYLARRVANAELLVLGVLGWIAFAFLTIVTVAAGWELTKGGVRQVDWHVYVAGAQDLLAHRLYAVALDLGGLVLSATQFNLPPLSAVWAVPLLPLPIEVGGEVWQLIAAASIAITAVLTAFIVGVRRPLLSAGAILGPLSFSIVYLEGLHLGTNNYLVLAMVGGFAWLMLRRRDRWAGLALGLAIGTKGWPVALVVPMVRERRWRVLGWAAATVLLQAVVFLLWLGPGFPVRMLETLREIPPPTGFLFGPSSVSGLRFIWESGGGVVVAVLLLALPLRGRSGIGAAILAGLAPIGNLWIHYGPTVMFAAALILGDAWWRLRAGRPDVRVPARQGS